MRSRTLWSIAAAFAVAGVLWELNQILIFRVLVSRAPDMTEIMQSAQNRWALAELVASALAGALLALHAGGRRHVESALASALGIGAILGLMRLDDSELSRTLVDGRFLAMLPLYPIAGAGTALVVARLAPTARAGRVATFVLAGAVLVGIAITTGFVAEGVHLPGWLIFVLLIAATFVSASFVQTLVTSRRIGAIAAAPGFYVVCQLIADTRADAVSILVLATIFPAASWLGARRAWKRKLALGTATEVQVPAARAR